MAKIYKSVEERIGNTLELTKPEKETGDLSTPVFQG